MLDYSKGREKAIEVGLIGLVWTIVFVICRFALFKQYSTDFSNRTVSILHALLMLTLTIDTIDFSQFYEHYGKTTTIPEMRILTISCAYFLYDTFGSIYSDLTDKGRIDPFMVGHHVVTLSGLLLGVFGRLSGAELTACLFLMEVSGPFMHLRSMLREVKLSDGRIGSINDVLFALTFSVARVGFGPKMVYRTLAGPSKWPVKIGAIGIAAVSFYWFGLIIRLGLRKAGWVGKKKTDAAKKAK